MRKPAQHRPTMVEYGSKYVYRYESGPGSEGASISSFELERGLLMSGSDDSDGDLWAPAGRTCRLPQSTWKDRQHCDSSDEDEAERDSKYMPRKKKLRLRSPEVQSEGATGNSDNPESVGVLSPSSVLSSEGECAAGKPDLEKVLAVKEPDPRTEASSHHQFPRVSDYSLSWPRCSALLNQIDGVLTPSKVFLLYCRDTDMQMLRGPFRKEPTQLLDEVLLLADLLNSCGGIICQFDGYDLPSTPRNWSVWTEKMIETSDFVITVCSPMLNRMLKNSQHELVNMQRGKFYVDVVVNRISPHKFIPIFLNMPSRDEWVPSNLQTSTYYSLNVSDFALSLGDTEGMHPRAFMQKMSVLFGDPRFQSITSLVAALRKEALTSMPEPSSLIIRPPRMGRRLLPYRPVDENPHLALGEAAGSRRANHAKNAQHIRRADTNIVGIQFSILKKCGSLHTGDAVICSNRNCTVALSHLSKLSTLAGREEKIWTCEFCGTENEVRIVPEEVPTTQEVTFMMSPPPVVGARDGVMEDSLVVFCVDISGSMCVTTEVPGIFELKGHDRVHSVDVASLNVEGQDQFLPNQNKDVTYVSRLQAMQAAVDHQLTSLAASDPTKRVVIVTFSDEVTVLSDKMEEEVTVAGDKLQNTEALASIADTIKLPACVAHTKDALASKIFSLKEGGQTALGPALVLSILIASRATESKVIVCTDGLANKGIGSLEGLSTDQEYADAQTFYEDLGALAQQKGVLVSLVTIKGTDCRVRELGLVADKAGGQVNIVDPLTITQQFDNIMTNPVIASHVVVKVIVHQKLYMRAHDTKSSVLQVAVGNVTALSEVTYEYGIKTKVKPSDETQPPTPELVPVSPQGDIDMDGPLEVVKSKKMPVHSDPTEVAPLTIDGELHYPFQIQIEYTAHNGSRLMKVITNAKPLTRDRNIAEKDADLKVVGTHAAQTSASLAQEGEYSKSRLSAFAVKKLLKKSSEDSREKRSQYASAMEKIIPLEHCLRDKQEKEQRASSNHCTYSGDEMVLECAEDIKIPEKEAKKLLRQKDVDDEMAALLYQMKHSHTSN